MVETERDISISIVLERQDGRIDKRTASSEKNSNVLAFTFSNNFSAKWSQGFFHQANFNIFMKGCTKAITQYVHKNTRLVQGSEAEEATNSVSQINIGTWDFEVWHYDSKILIVRGQCEQHYPDNFTFPKTTDKSGKERSACK